MSSRGSNMEVTARKNGLKVVSAIIMALFTLSLVIGALPVKQAHATGLKWKGNQSLPEVGKMVNQIMYPTFGYPAIVPREDTVTLEWDWRFGDATALPDGIIPPISDPDNWEVKATTSVAANVQHYNGFSTNPRDWYQNPGKPGYGTYENPVNTVINERVLPVTKVARGESDRWPQVFGVDHFPVEKLTVEIPKNVPFDLYDLNIRYLPDLPQEYKDWAPSDHDLTFDHQPHCLQVIKRYSDTPKIIQVTDTHVFGQEIENGGDGTGNLDYNSNELREPRPGTPNRDGLHGAHDIPLDIDGDNKTNEGAIYLQEQLQAINLVNPDFVVFTGDAVFVQHNFVTFPDDGDYTGGGSGTGYVGSEYRFEMPWWYDELLALNVPVFCVPGNHDGANWDLHNDYVTGSQQGNAKDNDGKELWQDLFGPLYFSWDYGKNHFLGIDTMDWPAMVDASNPPTPWDYGGGVGGLISAVIPEFQDQYLDRSGFLVDLSKFIIPIPLTIITPHKWHGQVQGGGDFWNGKNPANPSEDPNPNYPGVLWNIHDPASYTGQLGWIRDQLQANMGKSVRGIFLHHDPFKPNAQGKPDMWENPDMLGLFTYPGGEGQGSQALVYLMKKYDVAFEASGHAHGDWVGLDNQWLDGAGSVAAVNTTAAEIPVSEKMLTPSTNSNEYAGFRLITLDDKKPANQTLTGWGFAGSPDLSAETKWSIPGWAGLTVGANDLSNDYLKYRYNRPVIQWMEQDNGFTTQDPSHPEIPPRNEVHAQNPPIPGTFNRELPLNDKSKGGPYSDVTSNVLNTLSQPGAQFDLKDGRIEFPMKNRDDKSYYTVDNGKILEQYNADSGERMVVVDANTINGGTTVPVRVHKGGTDNERPVVDASEINGGAKITNKLGVKLALAAHDEGGAGMMDYRVSNSYNMKDAPWMPYDGAQTLNWTLDGNPGDFGVRSIYVQFRDAAMDGNVITRKLSIAYNGDEGPEGSVLINQGDETTQSAQVILTLKAEGAAGVKSMKVSNAPDLSNVEWQDFEGTIQWTVTPNAQGVATVYAQFKDGADLESPIVSDSIRLEAALASPAAPVFYFAEGTTRTNFDPYICIQNPGGMDASVQITYMKGDGSTQVQNLTVAAHSRSTVTVRNIIGSGDDAAHDFSAGVQTTNNVDIVAERPMYFNYNGVWTGGSDVMGAQGTNAMALFAEGTTRPNFDSYICIQNPSNDDAEVTITYMLGNGKNEEQKLVVPKTSRRTVKVNDFLNGLLGPGDDAAHDFSAKVVATNGVGIVAERPMYFNYKGVWTGGHDVVGIPIQANPVDFAEGTTRPNFDSYICIQNPDTEDSAVKITYMLGDGTTQEQTLTVPKMSRQTVSVNEFLNAKLGPGNDAAHDFSARVESTNGIGIVAERPMYFNYNGAWSGGHDVIGYDEQQPPENPTVFEFAEGTARPNFDPYVCIQNRNATDAQVRITYMLGDGMLKEQSVTVPKTSRKTVNVKEFLGSADDAAHDFSIKVESTNGVSILAERPIYFNYNGMWTGGHDVVGFPVPVAQ